MRFARQVLLTFGVRLALIPVGAAYSIVLARWLGPHDLGLFAVIGAWIGMALQFGALGLPTAVTRFAAGDATLVGPLIANARWTGLGMAALAWAALGLVAALAPAALGDVPRPLLALAALALPLNFASNQLQQLLLARERIGAYNTLEAVNRLLDLGVVLAALVLFERGLLWLIGGGVALSAVMFVAYQAACGRPARDWRPDLGLARRMLGFAARAWLTLLLSFLVLRSDLVLLNALAGPESAGVYSVAVRCSDFLLLLPAIAGALLMPRVARDQEQSPHFTALTARHAALLMGLGLAAVGVLAPWGVPFLFGDAYAAAVPALWLLLPAAWCMALQSLLSNDLAGRDYPAFLLVVWAVTLALNVSLNLLLIPRYGASGAAGASLAAYVLAFALVVRYWLLRFPGVSGRSLFVLRRADLVGLRELAADLFAPRGASSGRP